MQITMADADWQQFPAVAEVAEDFATSTMAVNLETAIKAQQKKQEKKRKRALADYQTTLAQESLLSAEKPAVLSAELPQRAPVKLRPPEKPPEHKEQAMTSTELSERMAQLEGVAVKRRTLAEAQELHDLLIMRKKQTSKTEAEQ